MPAYTIIIFLNNKYTNDSNLPSINLKRQLWPGMFLFVYWTTCRILDEKRKPVWSARRGKTCKAWEKESRVRVTRLLSVSRVGVEKMPMCSARRLGRTAAWQRRDVGLSTGIAPRD